mmetsp:Transcript_2498/g.8044  ORF Transcript_2498/g.8044 Transcript_2498/m.8044 type:complete len:271 (+) Transcript_2498:52-864(+)
MSLDVFTFMILLRRASCPPASFFLVVLSYWSSPTMNCCQFRESKFEGSTCKTNHLLLFPRPPAMADIQSLPSLQQLLLFLGNLYPVLRPCLQDLQDLFGRLVDLQDVSQRHLVSQLQGLAASEDTCQHLSTLVDTCRAVPHRRHDVLGSLQQSVVVDVDFCFVVLPHPPATISGDKGRGRCCLRAGASVALPFPMCSNPGMTGSAAAGFSSCLSPSFAAFPPSPREFRSSTSSFLIACCWTSPVSFSFFPPFSLSLVLLPTLAFSTFTTV